METGNSNRLLSDTMRIYNITFAQMLQRTALFDPKEKGVWWEEKDKIVIERCSGNAIYRTELSKPKNRQDSINLQVRLGNFERVLSAGSV